MNKYTIFARRIGLVGATQTITSLRGIITLPILTKTLGASGYGILAQILITIGLLMPFINLGLGASLVRFLPSKTKKEMAQGIFTALFAIFISGLIFSTLLFFSSAFLADFLIKDTTAVLIIQIASIFIIIQALETVASNSFRIFGQIKRYSIVMLSKTFLEVCLIAAFVLSGYGVIGVIFALTISEIAFLIIILINIVSYAGFASPNLSLLRPYLAFALPMIPLGIFETIVASSDRYVIGIFKGASSVGVYSAAYSLGVIACMVGPFIIFILGPTIANLYDKMEMRSVKGHLALSLRYYLMISIPSAFGLSILAKPLLTNLTTEEFVLMGIYIVPIVASGIIFYGLYGLFAEVLKLSKQTKIITIAIGIAGIVNLVLNFIVIQYWGVIGAAFTTLIAYVVATAILFYKSRQCVKFDINPKFIVKSILSSGVMVLVIWALKPTSTWNIILAITIGIIVYFFVLFILKGFEKQEIKTIIQVAGLETVYEKIFKNRFRI